MSRSIYPLSLVLAGLFAFAACAGGSQTDAVENRSPVSTVAAVQSKAPSSALAPTHVASTATPGSPLSVSPTSTETPVPDETPEPDTEPDEDNPEADTGPIEDTPPVDDAPVESVPCQGKFIDTHFHLETSDEGEDELLEDVAARLIRRMDEHSVGCAVAFYGFQGLDPMDEELAMLIESVEPFPNRFIPFFHVDPKTTSDLSRSRLEEILAATGDFVSFQGYGETAFYRHPWLGSNLTDPPWPDALDAMKENNLVVMIHLTPAQLPGFKSVLVERPGLTVLLHGPELVNELPELLKEHPNLYYTLDTATTMFLDGPQAHPLLYPRSGGRTEFLDEYAANRDTMLQSALSTWIPVLEAAPGRVMWGTDVSLSWHSDSQVYESLMEFSNLFLEELPSGLARAYAFDNALQLFGAGMVVDPASLDFLLGEDSEMDR